MTLTAPLTGCELVIPATAAGAVVERVTWPGDRFESGQADHRCAEACFLSHAGSLSARILPIYWRSIGGLLVQPTADYDCQS